MRQQNCVQVPQRFYLRAILCIFVPFLVSRCFYIARVCCSGSVYATETGLTLLRWCSIAFLCLSTAAAYTLITVAIYALGPKGAACITGICALRCLLDSLTQFFAESLNFGSASEQLSDYDMIMSWVTLLSEFFASVALAFGVWIMASAFYRMYKSRDCSRKYSLKNAVNGAVMVHFAVPFCRMLVRGFMGLVRENWTPSLSMMRSIVYEGLEIVVFYAIIAFVGSRVVLAVCTEREF